MNLKTMLRGGLAALVLSALPLSARAETIDVTAVAGHPPVFLWVKTLSESYIPAVNKALEGTDYKIDWTEAYGGTLAKVGGEAEAAAGNQRQRLRRRRRRKRCRRTRGT